MATLRLLLEYTSTTVLPVSILKLDAVCMLIIYCEE